MQECVSEFIAFITCEACEITNTEKRKTINGEDILKSMADLNFENYIPNVDYYNKKYQEMLKKTSGKTGKPGETGDES